MREWVRSEAHIAALSSLEFADDVPEVADPKESSSGSKALVSLLGGRDVDLKRVPDLLKVKLDSVNTLDKEGKNLVGDSKDMVMVCLEHSIYIFLMSPSMSQVSLSSYSAHLIRKRQMSLKYFVSMF